MARTALMHSTVTRVTARRGYRKADDQWDDSRIRAPPPPMTIHLRRAYCVVSLVFEHLLPLHSAASSFLSLCQVGFASFKE